MTTDPGELAAAVMRGDRAALGRAITLVESRLASDAPAAGALLQALHGRGTGTVRVGVSGPPGVGKSTLIETLGTWLCGRGHRVAVLAVDPSSATNGGSILGDKTRMPTLSRHPQAFVRPSPGGGALGGVAPRTREAIVVCEGAGHDVVLVETIGVGQSEIAVARMVDFVLLVVQPDSGDELQGIKRGITEVADAVFVNKADGERTEGGKRTGAEYEHALALLRRGEPPPVLVGSALTGDGVEAIWRAVVAHPLLADAGAKAEQRRGQARAWLEDALHDLLLARFLSRHGAAERLAAAYAEVDRGTASPPLVARRLVPPDGGLSD